MNKTENPGFPEGEAGREMLERMNGGTHAKLSAWGLEYFLPETSSKLLEIGCGGGANIARLLKRFPESHVTGVDYSELSIEMSKRTNKRSIKSGRVEVKKGNVLSLSFDDASFDAATAFETIYFWPDLGRTFAEVSRVLKKGGMFFICNETDGDDPEGYDWEAKVENLKIYKIDEVKAYLNSAGFLDVRIERKEENGWICFIAKKR